MKVVFAVTHLLGTGHLARVLILARAFQHAGHEATVLSGGMPAPHLDAEGLTLRQLPPLRSNGTDFSVLLDAGGAAAGDAYRAKREAELLDHLAEAAPDVVITELFPFGRRSLRHEFQALLQAATSMSRRPLILSSIRDILAPPSKPRKVTFADQIMAQVYDGVLVHSDPVVTPLELSWPVSPALAAKLHYTGFVAPAPAAPHPAQEGLGEIMVTAGGGDVGQGVFTAAREAARQDPRRRWRVLIGGAAATAQIAALRAGAPPNLHVEPARRDFRQMLLHAAASVSMCGYNTALDVLQSGCPAVFVPFDDGAEVEQGLRAAALAKLNQIAVVRTAELSGERLLSAVGQVLSGPARAPLDRADGAQASVNCVLRLLRQREGT